MEKEKKINLEIIYSNKKIADFEYDIYTKLTEVRKFLSDKFYLPINLIKLYYDKKELIDDNFLISKIVLTSLNKIGGEKIKIRIIPQLQLDKIVRKFKIRPFNNSYNEQLNGEDDEDNCFNFDYDLVLSQGVEEFKQKVYSIIENKMAEFNYKLDYNSSEFYNNPFEERLIFGKNNKNFNELITSQNFIDKEQIELYFLIKNNSIIFYLENKIDSSFYNNTNSLEKSLSMPISLQENNIRRNTSQGLKFNIILQTYNSSVSEVEVFAEMKISELKETIENLFGIRKSYQELIYLVYKLKDDNKSLSEYFIRPGGIIFLRGFYFPIIFTDYYERSHRNILGVNIAERVSKIKEEIIFRLNLNFDNFVLLCNGKELDEEKYLIDYNIQKLQVIYIK